MMGLMLIPLMGAVGFGIDTLRLHRAQQMLQQSVTAAASAYERSASDTQASTRIKRARDYFEQNYQAAAGGDMTLESFDLTPLGATGQVRITAKAKVQLFLIKFLGPDQATIAASIETTPSAQTLEVALALDVGGAMAAKMSVDDKSDQNTPMMTVLQNGALSVLQGLYPEGKPRPNIYAALIPFTQVVNVGKASRPWVSGLERIVGGGGAWRGCVMERTDLTLLESAPTDGNGPDPRFPAYTVPADSTAMKGQMKHRFITGLEPAHGGGINSGCGPEMLPLSSQPVQFWNKLATLSPAVLLAPQGDSKPYDNTPSVGYGASLASEGLIWGWRSLSPRWQGLWSGMSGTMPFPYDTQHVKALILITSGDLSLTDFDSALGRLSGQPEDNLLGAKTLPQAVEKQEARLKATCAGILKNKIRLYVVQLGGHGGPVGRTLKACLGAENLEMRYIAPETATESQAAFDLISQDLARFIPRQ